MQELKIPAIAMEYTISGRFLGSKKICMKLSILNLVAVRERKNH